MSDIATVSKHLFLLALCAACSPPGGSGGASVAPADRDYATQTRAPSPDYRALLDRPAPQVAKWGQTNRLVAGPFGSAREADQLVSRLKEKDVDSFRFTSDQGEEVKPLG